MNYVKIKIEIFEVRTLFGLVIIQTTFNRLANISWAISAHVKLQSTTNIK